MIKQEEVYKIGKIGKPHGVKGEVSFMFDDDIFDRSDSDYLVLEVDGILVPFFFDTYRFKTDCTALVLFNGIDSKDKAQELTGCNVYFPKALSNRADGELSWGETHGFTLIDLNSESKAIGTITGVDDSTMNVLFNVRTADGRDILVPAADDFIVNMDAKRREITVRLPEGLLYLDT